MKTGGDAVAEDKPKLRLIAGGPGPVCCTEAVCDAATCVTLPDEQTCGDCLWFSICHPLGFASARQRECDFFPSKFVRDEDDEEPNP